MQTKSCWNMTMRSNSVWCLLLLTLVTTYVTSTVIASNIRKPNMTVTGGRMEYGVYYMAVGQSANITCTVTSTAYNVSRLVIVYRDDVIGNITQVDDDSIQVTVTSLIPGTYAYRCCFDHCPEVFIYDPNVAGVTLKYSYPNVPVHNLSCVSPNYLYMNCSWRVNVTGNLFVWNMTYRIEGRKNIDSHVIMCPSELPTFDNSESVYLCQIENSSFYKTQIYTINVTGISDFSIATGGGRVHAGIDIVQYSPVENVKLVGLPSFTNLTVSWSRPVFISGADPRYRLTIWRHSSARKMYVGSNITNKTFLTLTNLNPATTYTIHVQAKPSPSPYWSTPSAVTVTTNGTGSQDANNIPNQRNIGAIVGVSVSLALIGVVCISCIVHHRKRLFSLEKIPIHLPKMIPVEHGIPPSLQPCNEVRQTCHDDASDTACDCPINMTAGPLSGGDIIYGNEFSSEFVSSETFDRRTPKTSSDVRPNTGITFNSSTLQIQPITLPSNTTGSGTDARRDNSNYVTVDSIANQQVVTNKEVYGGLQEHNYSSYVTVDSLVTQKAVTSTEGPAVQEKNVSRYATVDSIATQEAVANTEGYDLVQENNFSSYVTVDSIASQNAVINTAGYGVVQGNIYSSSVTVESIASQKAVINTEGPAVQENNFSNYVTVDSIASQKAVTTTEGYGVVQGNIYSSSVTVDSIATNTEEPAVPECTSDRNTVSWKLFLNQDYVRLT